MLHIYRTGFAIGDQVMHRLAPNLGAGEIQGIRISRDRARYEISWVNDVRAGCTVHPEDDLILATVMEDAPWEDSQ